MATDHKKLCVIKNDRFIPKERITHSGGRNDDGSVWKITQQEAIKGIQIGKWSFYDKRS